MKAKGFTLIELMIVIAIIGILAAVAVPQYANYTKRSKFTEVITQTNSAKTTVNLCFQETNGLATCNGTELATDYPGMYSNIVAPGIGHLESLTIAAGRLTAVGTSDVDGDDYILVPTVQGTNMTWALDPASTCIGSGTCRP